MNDREMSMEHSEGAERVLIVDDEPSMRTALMESVRRLGYEVQGAVDGADALERVTRFRPWLVITDLKMPRITGLDLIKDIKARAPQTVIVLMTAYGTVETAVDAMKFGASDYLLKPFSMDLLERVIANLKEGQELDMPGSAATVEGRAILTQDPGMIRLLSTVEGVAATSPDQIIAASGTGKSQFYHYFRSKEGLVHEVLEAWLEAVRGGTYPADPAIDSWRAWACSPATSRSSLRCISKRRAARASRLRTRSTGIPSTGPSATAMPPTLPAACVA